MELKASEDMQLPMQALDYWMRVRWHHERGDLERAGYFGDRSLSEQTPLLMLVSPALQFPPACETILRYFSPAIETIRVGLNESWRERLQVVFRQLRDELAELQDHAALAALAKRVLEMTHRIEQAAGALFSDPGYALLRAKLLARMVIDTAASTELLHQARVAPERRDLAEAFILRRALETEHAARRIEENAEGRAERDSRIVALLDQAD